MEEQLNKAEHLVCTTDDSEDVRSCGVTNVLMLTPNPYLVACKAKVDIKRGNAQKIADDLMPELQKRKAQLVALMSDTENNMQAAQKECALRWKDVEGANWLKLNQLLCSAHGYNLLLKDLFERIEYFHDEELEARKMQQFVANHQITSNLFTEVRKTLIEKAKADGVFLNGMYPDLEKYGETRFSSHVTSMESTVKNEDVYFAMVGDRRWRSAVMTRADSVFIEQAELFVKQVISDGDFFSRKQKILDLCNPIVQAISYLESDKPLLSQLYTLSTCCWKNTSQISARSISR